MMMINALVLILLLTRPASNSSTMPTFPGNLQALPQTDAEDEYGSPNNTGYEESIPSEYNVYESRESTRSYEGPENNIEEQPKSSKKSASQRDLLYEAIFSDYRPHERPTELLDQPTVVKVNMKVLAIFSVDVRTMDYYLDALLRQTWVDPRLAWNTSNIFKDYTEPLVSPTLKEKLWLPDLFFRNGKDGYLHKMTLPNYLIRVYPSGSVLYSQKITMRFSCQMDLQTFPMDKQKCDVNIGSYAYTLSELKFVWREQVPVELPGNLQISEFNTPTKFSTIDCTSMSNTSTGAYTCLLAKLTLKRQLGSYLVTTYIPNVLTIMVSWLSFWVNVDAAPARVPLGLLSLLGLLTQASSMTANLPRVSYIKALDLWLIFSIIFVVSVLVEYALAITLLRRKRKETWKLDVRRIVQEELARWCSTCQQAQVLAAGSRIGANDENAAAMEVRLPGYERSQLYCYRALNAFLTEHMIKDAKRAQKARRQTTESEIDSYSRFIFPTCYIMYNFCYWLYYLVIVNRNDNFDE